MSCSRISTFPLCFSVSVKAAFALLLPCLCALAIPAAEFIPFTHRGDTSNSETHTGLWFCVALGSAQEVAQMKTWLMPTAESVTGGVALKMIMHPGSKGALTREQGAYPASAGITFLCEGFTENRGADCSSIDIYWYTMAKS